MISVVFGWIGFVALILLAFGIIWLCVIARGASNEIMRTSQANFVEAANSLLETPNELPDMVLHSLNMMIKSGNDPKAHVNLLKAVRSKRAKESVISTQKSEIQKEVERLRPELESLYVTAMVSWLGYLTHQNIYTAIRIQMAMLKLRRKGLNQGSAEVETSRLMLGGIDASYC